MAISGMVPGYTAADAAVRLQRVQATCASLGLDAILFVGGVDGRDNLGSVHALNYLLGGVSGHELLERQQPVGSWAEDAVLLVRPTSCEIHLAPDAYDAVRPRIALWGDVQVHSLSPRRVLAAEAAADAAAAAKTRGRARHPADSDEDDPSDSPDSDSDDPSDSDDEDEDVLEDFKLLALVSMLAGANRVGVACTPGLARARDPAGAEAERWPLVQAYGLEGVGRPGFFTMTRRIVDCWTPLRDECYLRLDGPALRWELQRVLPPFERHWREVLEAMDKRSATSRAAVSETVAVEPLAEFFDFATLRRPVDVDPFPPSDAPRLRFGARTDPDVDFNEGQEDVDGSREARGAATATHFTLSSAHPKSPGAFAARTYFLANGARDVALANGFSRVSQETEGAEMEGADATEGAETEGADPNAANASLLRALYACVVSAGRAAMRSAAADPSGDVLSAARAAFVAAADAFGVPSRAADRLRVDVVAVTPANRLASSPARARWVARRVFARLGGVVGVDGVPLGGVAYGDSFVVDADGEPLVLTSCVPLSAAWPSAGVESDFVDGCADVVVKTARDAAAARFAGTKTRTRRTTKGKPRGDGRVNDAVRRSEGETDGRAEGWTNPLAAGGGGGDDGDDDGDDDDEVLIDAELEMSADEDEDDVFADAGVVSDDDVSDDDDEPTAPASRRYALDPALALGPRLLAPRLDGVLRFRETPDPTTLDDVDAGEGVDAGAWYAFENGVAFVPASAPPLALVVGANVVAVDVHEGIRDPDDEPASRGAAERDAADALVVFRLAKNAPGSRGSDPDASTAWCFSLAATPVAARRRFLREIVPRWRAAAANANDVSDVSDVSSAATVRVTAALPAYARATEAQRWAVGRARALARQAGNIAAAVAGGSATHKTFPTHAADARVADAADATSGFETTRRQPRDSAPTDEKTNHRREMKTESETTAEETTAGTGFCSPSIPVTLLTGPPGGCQASTASALTEGASASATWIVARVESLRAFAAPTASCFASALEDASRRARRALREASDSSVAAPPPPPRVLVTVATYAPPAITIAALRGAIERVNAEAEANAEASTDANAARDSAADAGSAPSLRHEGTTACLTSDAFFAEGERRPSLGSLAHAASNDVDVVVLLQGSHRSRSGAGAGSAARDAFGLDGDDSTFAAADSSSVGDRERFADASAWVRAAARGDVERIFGAARLGRDPLAAAATRSTPATRRFAPAWESTLVASHADAPVRARVSARRVVAVGRFDVAALVASVRRAFGAGRVAPPLGPDATAAERAERDATRFLERDPNDETRAATLAWARVRAWTNARVDTGAEEETELELDTVLDTEPRSTEPRSTEPRWTEPRSTEPRWTEPRWKLASASATKETDADAGTTPDLVDERARVIFDASFDFASAAPFSLASTTSSGMDATATPTTTATMATRVEVIAAGSDVATRLDLGAMCRAAVVAAPAPAPRKTEASMSAKERAAIAETCESAPTPEGWYHDGARYVRYDGVVSAEHPSLREAIEAYLRDANAEAEERDAARMAANARHAATARVALEETSEACE